MWAGRSVSCENRNWNCKNEIPMLLLLIKCPHILFLQREPQITLSFRNPERGALHHRSPIYRSHCLALYFFSSFLRPFTIKHWSASCWKAGHCHPPALLPSHRDCPAADLSRCLYTNDSHVAISTYCDGCWTGTLFSGYSKAFLPESRIFNNIKLRDGALKFRF